MPRISSQEKIVDAETLIHFVIPTNPETIKSIGKFAIIWNYLEDQMRQKHKKAGYYSISQKIDNSMLFGYEETIDRLYEKLEVYMTREWNGYNANNLRDCFGISFENPYKDIEEKDYVLIFNGNGFEDKLKLLFLVAKRIRNNMFHGINGKQDLDRLDKQRDLFEIGYDVISIIVRLRKKNSSFRFVYS